MFSRRRPWRTAIKVLLWLVVLLSIVVSGGYYLTHYNDEWRIVYKRFKAVDKYVFDEINPRFLQTDPTKLVSIKTPEIANKKRAAVVKAIWGDAGLPIDQLPVNITTVAAAADMSLTGVEKIERLEIPHDFDLKSVTYVIHPVDWNGQAVVYQHGYAGTFHQMSGQLQKLVDAGFLVGVSNFFGYGENIQKTFNHPKFGVVSSGYDNLMLIIENPLRVYVDPILLTMNYIYSSTGVRQVNVVGFSAGGWIATLAAASDPRIEKTFAAASLYPLYLRENLHELREAPRPQLYAPLLWASNYLDMFALAASGEGRSYTQVFNQFDRCCYRNRKGKLYEEAVQKAVASTGVGQFEVLIDTTHAEHQVSDWAMNEVLARLLQK